MGEAHWGKKLTAARAAEIHFEWQRCRVAGTDLAWCDLQLPLYALVARDAFGAVPEVGYFHLARSVDECVHAPWPELDAAALESAQRCAEGVVEAVRARVFWPPNPAVAYDDFARLFCGTDAAERRRSGRH